MRSKKEEKKRIEFSASIIKICYNNTFLYLCTMELIYFFIGLGVLGTVGYIWVRWFYKENDNEDTHDIELQAEQ